MTLEAMQHELEDKATGIAMKEWHKALKTCAETLGPFLKDCSNEQISVITSNIVRQSSVYGLQANLQPVPEPYLFNKKLELSQQFMDYVFKADALKKFKEMLDEDEDDE